MGLFLIHICDVDFSDIFNKNGFIFFLIGGPQPAVLQKVNVPVWTNQECKFKYGAAAPGGIVDHFLCAGKAAKDSCSVSKIVVRLSYLNKF